MDTIICPECGKEISAKVLTCPNCGYPVSDIKNETFNSNIAESISSRSKKKIPLKRIIILASVVLAIVIGVFVIVKVTGNPLAGKHYYYYVHEHERYSLDFTRKNVKVSHIYDNDSSRSTVEFYDYDLLSRSEFKCKGKTYSFTQSSQGHNDSIEFDSKFMGIARSWE